MIRGARYRNICIAFIFAENPRLADYSLLQADVKVLKSAFSFLHQVPARGAPLQRWKMHRASQGSQHLEPSFFLVNNLLRFPVSRWLKMGI